MMLRGPEAEFEEFDLNGSWALEYQVCFLGLFVSFEITVQGSLSTQHK